MHQSATCQKNVKDNDSSRVFSKKPHNLNYTWATNNSTQVLHTKVFFSPQKQQRVSKLETMELNYLDFLAKLRVVYFRLNEKSKSCIN